MVKRLSDSVAVTTNANPHSNDYNGMRDRGSDATLTGTRYRRESFGAFLSRGQHRAGQRF